MKTILLVDDEAEILDVLRMALELAGYCVETAYHGQAGLERLGVLQLGPDLIVTDLMMPVMTGAGMIEAMRAAGRTNVPAILMTAVPRAASQTQHRALFRHVLQKPFRVTQLLTLVETVIGPPS